MKTCLCFFAVIDFFRLMHIKSLKHLLLMCFNLLLSARLAERLDVVLLCNSHFHFVVDNS